MRLKANGVLVKIVFVFAASFMIFLYLRMTYQKNLDKILPKYNLNEFYKTKEKPQLQIRQNGEFWILENYIIADKQFDYLDSVTYTTHGEYTYLDNLEEIVKRWNAPISVAIFAPDSDFYKTLQSIVYLRKCAKDNKHLRDLVTFHLYFPASHMPAFIPKTLEELSKISTDCAKMPPFMEKSNNTYRHKKSIFYPINVSRNIARRLAKTHFIFPSDIEMYPNWNFAERFMAMVRRKPDMLFAKRKVYPLAVFEVERGQRIPNKKRELIEMINAGKAIPFHQNVCQRCHEIPELDRWLMEEEIEDMLDVFLVAKHQPSWEPFYITTNSEPFFDERYTWEGRYDKQIQAVTLSIINYDFCILKNAFLVHRPGIKEPISTESYKPQIEKMKFRTASEILPQLRILYASSSSTENENRK